MKAVGIAAGARKGKAADSVKAGDVEQ